MLEPGSFCLPVSFGQLFCKPVSLESRFPFFGSLSQNCFLPPHLPESRGSERSFFMWLCKASLAFLRDWLCFLIIIREGATLGVLTAWKDRYPLVQPSENPSGGDALPRFTAAGAATC